MPKYSADQENVTAEGPEVSIAGDEMRTLTAISKKELGRLKSKQAVLAAKAKTQQPEALESGFDKDAEPDTKRARSAVDSGKDQKMVL